MSQEQMPIFTRSFDFLSWLLPITNHFPKAQRHSFTHRLLEAAFDLREQLEAANHRKGKERLAYLDAADLSLDRVRLYLRLAAQRDLFPPPFHRPAARLGQGRDPRMAGERQRAGLGEPRPLWQHHRAASRRAAGDSAHAACPLPRTYLALQGIQRGA
jgi:hypothetical protein